MNQDVQADTKQHLSDMEALDEHILEAVEGQLAAKYIQEDPDALDLLTETQQIFKRHIAEMKGMVEQQDAETRTGLKAMLTSFLGNIAGLYNHVRSDGASRAVRDTYTALSLTSAALTALKTFGLMVGKEQISSMAYNHLGDILPLIIKFNKRLPYIVARETAKTNGLVYDAAIPARVENATQRLWNGGKSES